MVNVTILVVVVMGLVDPGWPERRIISAPPPYEDDDESSVSISCCCFTAPLFESDFRRLSLSVSLSLSSSSSLADDRNGSRPSSTGSRFFIDMRMFSFMLRGESQSSLLFVLLLLLLLFVLLFTSVVVVVVAFVSLESFILLCTET